jgi:hypothetical protein
MRSLVRLIVWIVADLFRSRAALETENSDVAAADKRSAANRSKKTNRPVKQGRAHDPLKLRDALGDDRGHEIALLRSGAETSRFRDGNEGTHRGDRIHSSRFTKTEPSTSTFFR